MPDLDLIVRRGSEPPIGIADGRIVSFEEGWAREEIDADECEILPGVIDSHVHFNEPGRADWEGISTGSQACAAGGTTMFCDMPLNSTPPVIDRTALETKRRIGEHKSYVDFGLWAGLIPGNLDQLEGMRDAGAIALKAFMSNSGIDDFPKADAATLRAGMKAASALGLLVGVHAEIDHPELCQGSSIREYLASRPISMELEAIDLALTLAGETGCALHVVHVSSAAGVRRIAEARSQGVNVSCETCPHYLVLNEEDVERLGAVAKCAPPIRSEAERLLLLEQVVAGAVQTIGSDHSPAPPGMKTAADFYEVWGGVSGCQHLLPLLMELGLERDVLRAVTAQNVAERFGLKHRKGRIAIGCDADLVIIERTPDIVIRREDLRYRHAQSPYVGRILKHRVRRTVLRGRTIFVNGQIVGKPAGQFFRPQS